MKSHLAGAPRPLGEYASSRDVWSAGVSRIPPLSHLWAAVEKEASVNKSWEELRLPPGYQLELDPDMLVLRRPDGSAVAAFSGRGATPDQVEAAAWEDAAGGKGRDGPQAPEEPLQRD